MDHKKDNDNHQDNQTTTTMTTTMTTKPMFVMPAEWEKHYACMILFPHNPYTFRLQQTREQVLQVALAIAIHGQEQVWVLINNHNDNNNNNNDNQILEQVQFIQKYIEKEKHPYDSTTHNNNNTDNNNTNDTITITSTTVWHTAITSIQIRICPSDDTWVRDTGPTCCWKVNNDNNDNNNNNNNKKELIGVDWGFNGYGGPIDGCYWPCMKDRQVAKHICDLLNSDNTNTNNTFSITHFDATEIIILEGGSIHTDGQGTLLVTKECLLNPNRNPQFSQMDIEKILCHYLGSSKIIWLPYGVDADEDTNGHIDNFCCFVQPGHVVLSWTDDESLDPENYRRCRQAESILSSTIDAMGRSIQVHRLYLPQPPLFYTKDEVESLIAQTNNQTDQGYTRQVGEKMAGSYVNFYIANKAVIVPQFGCTETDAKAIETLTNIFAAATAAVAPNEQGQQQQQQEQQPRVVVGVFSRDILMGGGNIHCITQQIPALE